MLEALMLVLLGALIAALAALALAPLLWSRAARVTAERVQQDVHSAAFSEASQHVSRRYEGEIAQREGALRSEIEQLEASREKISAEASGRVSALEEARARLEQEIADRDAQLAESQRMFDSLAENVRSLGARADALGREAADLGSRAGALSSEIADLGQSHHQIARTLHSEEAGTEAGTMHEPRHEPQHEPQTVAHTQTEPETDPEPEPAPAPDANSDPVARQDTYELSTEDEADGSDDKTPAPPVTLSDRIRALRDGVSA